MGFVDRIALFIFFDASGPDEIERLDIYLAQMPSEGAGLFACYPLS